MANITYPNTLANNTTADADQVMANFNAVTAQFNGNIDSSNLGNGIVTGAKIATDTITAGNIASDAITQSELGPLSVGTPELIDNSVTNVKMADDSVGNAELLNDSVGNPEMKDASVGTAELIDGAVTVAKLAGDASAVVVPTGTILATGRSTPPTGYLMCDGSVVSRGGANAALFAAIGIAYGAGDGSTTFKIPDLRGRAPVGEDGAAARLGSNDALGQASGTETVTLSTAQIPSHTHSTSLAPYTLIQSLGGGVAGGGVPGGPVTGYITSPSFTTDGGTGGGGSHSNMSPYQIVNYIIKL